MAGNLTNYEERRLLDNSLTSRYLGLFTVAPIESSAGTEVSGGGYVRQPLSFAAAATDGAGATTKTSNTTVTFPAATLSWGTLLGWGIFDAASAGNLLWYYVFSTSAPDERRTISVGNQYTLAAGYVVCALD